MKWIFLLACSLACATPKFEVERFSKDLKARKFQALAEKIDLTIDAIIDVSAKELTDEGFGSDAYFIQSGWKSYYKGRLLRHDIGDHPEEELIPWISASYKTIEKDICGTGHPNCAIISAFHISDLYTINETLKLAFQPCHVDKNEFKLNMVQGQFYTGLYPVLVYWTVLIATVNSAGVFASTIAMGSEWLCEYALCGYLSDFIYDEACG